MGRRGGSLPPPWRSAAVLGGLTRCCPAQRGQQAGCHQMNFTNRPAYTMRGIFLLPQFHTQFNTRLSIDHHFGLCSPVRTCVRRNARVTLIRVIDLSGLSVHFSAGKNCPVGHAIEARAAESSVNLNRTFSTIDHVAMNNLLPFAFAKNVKVTTTNVSVRSWRDKNRTQKCTGRLNNAEYNDRGKLTRM